MSVVTLCQTPAAGQLYKRMCLLCLFTLVDLLLRAKRSNRYSSKWSEELVFPLQVSLVSFSAGFGHSILGHLRGQKGEVLRSVVILYVTCVSFSLNWLYLSQISIL